MRDMAAGEPGDGGGAAAWGFAILAATVLAVDPHGLGGVRLRALPGPARDAFLDHLRRLCPEGAPWRRVPLGVGEDRLLGGLDLAATLAAGRPVGQAGLIAEADGGLLILPGAERLPRSVVAHLAAALDEGAIRIEREGLRARHAARLGVVALDEGIAADEAPAAALTDRLGFWLDLGAVSIRDLAPPEHGRAEIDAARARLASVAAGEGMVEALCATAAVLGIGSLRAPQMALRAARALAALDGRAAVEETDLALAVQLVLAPRATCLPAPEETAPPPDEAPEPESPPEAATEDDARPLPPLDEILLAAVEAALPEGVLDRLRAGAARPGGGQGKAGQVRSSVLRGRPLGARRGEPRGGARLALIDTLRAAAPWQPLRQRAGGALIEVRRDDFRIRRFRERAETTTLFVVDASGSSALARLAEAKGAVELMLAEAYRRRDHVALISFRGQGAELVLPPTRSLLRAKRSLAGLPGGGGTPLAAALDAAAEVAGAVARRGQTPVVVVLTDGKANVARDGAGGRSRAAEEAQAAARRLRADGVSSILIDTSPRPAPEARAIAGAMGASYLALPRADARRLSDAVRAASPAG
ncbi:magnesium chelatase subunit D [Thermohalobaculum sediminis]|uniref:magnesium chelatase subunit D n=1 Tax=Thermohalobaculum sediminis TaxID=2939436 RepID=UPI0029E7E301|nr:magnesium chelatase subunit D [Limibaculum sediminis]